MNTVGWASKQTEQRDVQYDYCFWLIYIIIGYHQNVLKLLHSNTLIGYHQRRVEMLEECMKRALKWFFVDCLQGRLCESLKGSDEKDNLKMNIKDYEVSKCFFRSPTKSMLDEARKEGDSFEKVHIFQPKSQVRKQEQMNEVVTLVSKSIYYYIQQFFFSEDMSCYLKVSYLNRHRKYAYRKEKPINFQQIHKELQVPFPPEVVTLIVSPQQAQKREDQQQSSEIRMSEKDLCSYLNSIQLAEKETVRIRVIETSAIDKTAKREEAEEKTEHWQSSTVLRTARKTEEMKIQTVTVQLKTDFIDVTQQFLCNSMNDRFDDYPLFDKEEIMMQLKANRMRQKEVDKNKKLKNIAEIYEQIKKAIE